MLAELTVTRVSNPVFTEPEKPGVDVKPHFWRLGTGAEYETSRRTIGRDDSYPVLGRSEP